MTRVEIVDKETRERDRLCWSYQDALGVLAAYVAGHDYPGREFEVWSIADDEIQTRMSLYATVIVP